MELRDELGLQIVHLAVAKTLQMGFPILIYTPSNFEAIRMSKYLTMPSQTRRTFGGSDMRTHEGLYGEEVYTRRREHSRGAYATESITNHSTTKRDHDIYLI